MTTKPDTSLIKNPDRRVWLVVFVVTGVFAIAWLTATATFLFNVENKRFVANVGGFGVEHNCLTSYAVASHLATKGTENLYDPSRYRDAVILTPIHDQVQGTFTVDAFHYPPPFLILPKALITVFGGFFPMRAAWFVMTVACFLGALIGLASWCGAFRSQPRLLVFPVLLCAPTLHVALQIGNAHLLIISISVLAMIAIEENRFILGGGLLGFAVAAKFWPAIFVVLLLLQKRWKPAFWCAIAVAVYSLGALLFFGPEPYSAFVSYELPRISSGEAFGFMGVLPRAIITNMSVFGIPQKLHALGVLSSKPALVSPVLSWSFTVLVGAIVIATGLRRRKEGATRDDSDRLASVQLWIALLTLAQLHSPFLPWPYGVISTLWLLLFLSVSARGWKLGIIFVAWLILSINVPLTFVSDTIGFHLSYTLFALVLIYGAILAGVGAYWARSWRYAHTRRSP